MYRYSFRSRTRIVRVGPLVFSKSIAMNGGSKRPLSSLSKPVPSSIDDDLNDKKLRRSLDSDGLVDENDGAVNSAGNQSMKDCLLKIDVMTVPELRATLRSAGLPAKGRKYELVSSLKCYLDQEFDDNDKLDHGELSPEKIEHLIARSPETSSTTTKGKKISDEGDVASVNCVSENNGLKKSKNKDKVSRACNKIVKLEAKVVTTDEEKLSLATNGVSVEKSSRTKRKISCEVTGKDLKLATQSDLPHIEPWTILAHKKPQKGWVPYNPRVMRPPPLNNDTKHVKLMSWNVNGLRALLKLEGFSTLELVLKEDFDVLCLQETKLQEKDVESIRKCLIEGYENTFWSCSVSKLGYSGTAIISRIKPLSVKCGLGIADHDSEGRIVTAEFDSFYLVSGYVPNSGDGLKRLSYRIAQWDPSLSDYLKELEKSKPVILTGDLNCAHQEIDIYNPAGNKRSAGFTEEERESFGKNFLSRGFVDTFRRQHPNVVGYTYWGYRHGGRKTNKGWRLDYFLVSETIADRVHDSYIVPEIAGSDHCPIGLILKL